MMRWLDGWMELVMDRDAWHAAVHGVTKSDIVERLNGTERKANQALPLACCFPQVMVQTDEHCVAKTLILLDFPFFPLTYGLIMTRLGLMKESSNCFLFG